MNHSDARGWVVRWQRGGGIWCSAEVECVGHGGLLGRGRIGREY